MIDYYRAYVSVTGDKILEVERVTRGRSSSDNVTNNLWLTERHKRITSSVTDTITKCKSTTKVAPLVKPLLYNPFQGNAAMQYGHIQETATHEAYFAAKQASSPGISIHPSGLLIHPTHHREAASPDNLVTDPSLPDQIGILEYK